MVPVIMVGVFLPPAVVDFSPLAGTDKPMVDLTVRFGDGGTRRIAVEWSRPIKTPGDAADVAREFCRILKDSEKRYDVEVVGGKLVIKGRNGKCVLSIRCTAHKLLDDRDGFDRVGPLLGCEFQPLVRRLQAEKK
jgi:hypothetical protein